jgi:pimeloyl-ACP methyl ester carboxylesterase
MDRIGVRCSVDTNAAIAAHFERGTLVQGLPGVRMPAFFIHGAADPLPPRSSIETAALIPGARVELIDDCGHFPWLERPGEVLRAYQLFQ